MLPRTPHNQGGVPGQIYLLSIALNQQLPNARFGCLMYTHTRREFARRYPAFYWLIAVFGAFTVHSTPPQSQRMLSVALMLTGLVIAAIAIVADTINIGTGKGFGYYQMIVLIAGIVIFLIGILVIVGNRSSHDDSGEFRDDS